MYFNILKCISTQLGDKVYILLTNSCVKLYAKICTNCWNVSKSYRGLLFICSPCISSTNND